MACGEEIANHSVHLKAAYSYMQGIYNSCGTTAEIVATQTPCNYIAADLLKAVWGFDDFQKNGRPMLAVEINEFLQKQGFAVGIGTGPWRRVDPDDAILAANNGDPVFASTVRHIALVIPGAYVYSQTWGEDAPEVIALSRNDLFKVPPNVPLRCFPCTASQTFDKDDKPKYFVRGSTP